MQVTIAESTEKNAFTDLVKELACLHHQPCISTAELHTGKLCLQVLMWDLKQQQGARGASGDGAAPGPDGLYAPLRAGDSAVNSICYLPDTGSQFLAAGLESGHLSLFAVS